MHSQDAQKELTLLIQSRYPFVYLETWEEERVEAILAQVARRLKIPLFVWTVTRGLVRAGMPNPIYQTEAPLDALNNIASFKGDAIFLLKDFHRHWNSAEVIRRLRDLEQTFSQSDRAIVFAAPVTEIPLELEKDVARLALGLPGLKELQQVVGEITREARQQAVLEDRLGARGLGRLARNLSGLTLEEARRVLRRCLLARKKLDEKTVTEVLEAKRAELGRAGILEFIELGDGFDGLGGLRQLRKWLEQRRGAFGTAAAEFGLEPPRGILILGVQGCGKSLLAKAVAAEWQLPLVRLDPARLYDKYIGESERRLRQSLEGCDRMAPLVLWIDEIEKGFAATQSSAEVDAGLSQRLLGSLLSWLQEKRSGVFVAATCNDVSALPPELLRKGRFDEIFFVDLPDAGTRREILCIHLRKRNRDPEQFDLDVLVEASQGFSGAELEQLIRAALYTAFDSRAELTAEVLLAEMKKTYPLAVTRREDIERLRAWARGRTVPAH